MKTKDKNIQHTGFRRNGEARQEMKAQGCPKEMTAQGYSKEVIAQYHPNSPSKLEGVPRRGGRAYVKAQRSTVPRK
ncbi:MAG: hypothetical protein LUE99_06120 [Bacteroides sp.]|nr:hypothetical protein [Bacteroides sp.]